MVYLPRYRSSPRIGSAIGTSQQRFAPRLCRKRELIDIYKYICILYAIWRVVRSAAVVASDRFGTRGIIGFPSSKEGNRGDAMVLSLPCPNCGQVDDLETVNPLGILMDKAVIWNCRCGSTRAVGISHHAPQELVRKAMVMDETRDWASR